MHTYFPFSQISCRRWDSLVLMGVCKQLVLRYFLFGTSWRFDLYLKQTETFIIGTQFIGGGWGCSCWCCFHIGYQRNGTSLCVSKLGLIRRICSRCGYGAPGMFLLQAYPYTYSLLRGVTFEVLTFSSYARSPTMLPLLKIFLDLLLWNSFQCNRHTVLDVFSILKSSFFKADFTFGNS